MIDLGLTRAGQLRPCKRLANAPAKLGQRLDAFEAQILLVVFDKEKPVATPGDISRDAPISSDLDAYTFGIAVTGHIMNRDATILQQFHSDHAYRGLDAVCTLSDTTQVGECGDQSNGAMSTHAQVGDVIEEDHASRT